MSLRALSRLRAVALVGIGLLVSAASALTTGSARAAEPTTTFCTFAHPLTAAVTGNLVVPAGQVCDLDYDVAGNAMVETGGELDGGAKVTGNLHLGHDASALLVDSAGVGGYVVLDHANGFVLYDANVGGSVIGSLETAGALSLDSVVLGGRLAVTGTGPGAGVYSDSLKVVGDVVLDGVRVALLGGVTLGGRVVLRHVHDGDPSLSPDEVWFTSSVVCGGHVHGNVSVDDSTGRVDVGAGAVCFAAQYRLTTEGSFLAHDNTASVFVGGDVGGDAVCRANLHHPRGDGTTTGLTALHVDGRRLGQCSRLPRP